MLLEIYQVINVLQIAFPSLISFYPYENKADVIPTCEVGSWDDKRLSRTHVQGYIDIQLWSCFMDPICGVFSPLFFCVRPTDLHILNSIVNSHINKGK